MDERQIALEYAMDFIAVYAGNNPDAELTPQIVVDAADIFLAFLEADEVPA